MVFGLDTRDFWELDIHEFNDLCRCHVRYNRSEETLDGDAAIEELERWPEQG